MTRPKQRPCGSTGGFLAFPMPPCESKPWNPVARSVHLLDRDRDCLLFLSEYLTTAGFDVSGSSAVEDALERVARFSPNVLIAEKDAPAISGLDLVDTVRAISPGTRVVLTTERLDPGLGNQLLCLGDVDLVVKPFNWMVLMRAVERALKDIGRDAARAAAPPPLSRKGG